MANQVPRQYIEGLLSQPIVSISPVGGGSINDVYRLDMQKQSYLLKVNSASRYPQMFEREAEALALIAATDTMATPRVIHNGVVEDNAYLLLEWIPKGRPTATAMNNLGIQLAAMHRCTADAFGLEHDNYMGSLHQSNKNHDNWADFFINQRLMPMVTMATEMQLLKRNDATDFENLYKRLPDLFDEEPPSLIHGDLWSGNYLVEANDKPYLIDPALAYGHREFDIAMTTLFGGFSADFYDAYNKAFPLAQGWQERLDLWNLYPLLVHLNLFGAGYLQQVRSNISRYL